MMDSLEYFLYQHLIYTVHCNIMKIIFIFFDNYHYQESVIILYINNASSFEKFNNFSYFLLAVNFLKSLKKKRNVLLISSFIIFIIKNTV